MRRFLAWTSIVVSLGIGRHAAADDAVKRWSYNDYGGVGLLQTRNARMADDGQFTIGYTHVEPHEGGFITFQALPWLEGSFGYSRFAEKPPNQDLFDRNLDAKIRLVDEGRWWPAISVGFQDMLGTGRFSGEYVVASRRIYDFDVSLGIGWGRLGTRADFKNPLTLFSSSFERRGASTGVGGQVRFGDFFRGANVALFGGIEYITPIDGVRLKVELDGSNYLPEQRLAPDFELNSRINFGIEYQPFPWLGLAAAYEHGDALMLRITTGANLKTAKAPPKIGQPPVRPVPRPKAAQRLKQAIGTASARLRAEGTAAPKRVAGDVTTFYAALAVAGLDVGEVDHSGSTLRIALDRPVPAGQLARARAVAREAAALLPIPVSAVEIVAPAQAAPRPPRPRPANGHATQIAQAPRAPAAAAAPQAVQTRAGRTAEAVRDILEKDLPPQGFKLYGVAIEKREVTVFLSNGRYREPALGFGRAARVIANALPPSIEVITIVEWSSGLETSRVSILRKDLEHALAFRGSPEEIWQNAELASPTGSVPDTTARVADAYPDFDWSLTPATRQSFFDPNVPVLYQLWARLNGNLAIARGLDISATLGYDIVNNFDRSTRRSNSKLPHVRSDITKYLKQGKNNIARLQANYVWNMGPDVYGRVTGGLLEEMYGGISGEVLYRPYRKRWAVGLELNQVWQRAFDQRFDFRDYHILTGHLSTYYQTPYHNYLIAVSAGRYLAGDWGATFSLVRRFESGISVGGFATFTDVPFDVFGEGSFDKGIFLSIPLDLFFTRHTRRYASTVIRPLTRDGGQRVSVSPRLYDLTDADRYQAMQRSWRQMLD